MFSLASTSRLCGAQPAERQVCTRSHSTPVVGFQSAPRGRPDYVPNRIDDANYVRIFDTTLRDGEQSPGATLNVKEKLEIAKQLALLGVDVIEAGFPISSPDDFAAVKEIALQVGNEVQDDGYVPVICGMGRTVFKDLERTWEAVKHAKHPRVHMVLATSEIHMKHKLKMTRDQVIENAIAAVKHLQAMGCYDIEFCAEDASRSDPEFLYQVLGEVIKAGATTLNIPDTVGWSMPHEYQALVAGIKANTPGVENVLLSTHCHDDLGLAAANSLAGVMAGARQVEVCVNGIGERAGNASLEQVVMTMALKGPQQMNGMWTGVNPVYIYPASRMVSHHTGMMIQPHRAIVGANAFLHECGMHQDGILKNRETYEIMSPETIGLERTGGLVLGKLSGRKALVTRLQQLGFDLEADELNDVFLRFKALADKKKTGITDDDLLGLVTGDKADSVLWQLTDLQVVHGTLGIPTCRVGLKGPDGIIRVSEGVGTGPVDAAFKAIDSLVQVDAELMDYTVNACYNGMAEGSEVPATTHVTIRPSGDHEHIETETYRGVKVQMTFTGQGADADLVVASAHAYVSALNKFINWLNAVNTRSNSLSSLEFSSEWNSSSTITCSEGPKINPAALKMRRNTEDKQAGRLAGARR